MSEHDWDAALAELTDITEASTGIRLVDSPEAQATPTQTLRERAQDNKRRPIIPEWMRSKAEVEQVVKWAAEYAGHVAMYHTVRVPKYAGKLAARSPRGMWRAAKGWWDWQVDAEAKPLRKAAVVANSTGEYVALARLRKERIKTRAAMSAAASLLTAALLIFIVLGCDAWLQAVCAAIGIAVFGAAGTPADKPLLDTAVTETRVRPLTSKMVTDALCVLGIGGMNEGKGSDRIHFVDPIAQDGPGWRAEVDLPPGITAGEVMDKREKLAAGLSRPLGCVWPEGVPDAHPGRLTLWVGKKDMAKAEQPAWPLAKSGKADLFKPFPFGTDPRGRSVEMELMYSNMLIGAMPGAGKTFALKVPLLAAALDPRAELWVYELKGSGDLSCFKKVAARYASGAADDKIEQALESLRDLRKECQRRAEVIANLPADLCPENKVTPELASKKSLGLHPLVMNIDECQELFSHKDFGKEAGELAEKCIKLGRAFGIILLLATQRPDKDSLPTGVSANVGTRFCLRVMGQVENDMILGTSSYKNGLKATMFTRSDRGIGYLVGGDDPQIVRTYKIDALDAERVCDRARALREAQGRLSGYALHGEQATKTKPKKADLLADVLTVLNEPKAPNAVIVERLAELRPEVYGLWMDAAEPGQHLTAALKPLGVATGQVWVKDADDKGSNKRGITRADVVAAKQARS